MAILYFTTLVIYSHLSHLIKDSSAGIEMTGLLASMSRRLKTNVNFKKKIIILGKMSVIQC